MRILYSRLQMQIIIIISYIAPILMIIISYIAPILELHIEIFVQVRWLNVISFCFLFILAACCHNTAPLKIQTAE